MIDTTSMKITLTTHEKLCLTNIQKAGQFRSASHTIGECILFIQALRDNPLALEVLGKRFGISVANEKKSDVLGEKTK